MHCAPFRYRMQAATAWQLPTPVPAPFGKPRQGGLLGRGMLQIWQYALRFSSCLCHGQASWLAPTGLASSRH
jgi:hypothetical protein